MVEIITASNDLTAREKIQLTVGKGHLKLDDIPDGETIEVKSYVVFNVDGKRAISIKTTQNVIYSGISVSFIDSFLGFSDLIPELIEQEGKLTIGKMTNTSKNGRKYIICTV